MPSPVVPIESPRSLIGGRWEGVVGSMEAIMHNVSWNKGRLTGQKRPLKPKDVWAIRVRLQLKRRARDLALFNLAIDSKLRGCDRIVTDKKVVIGIIDHHTLQIERPDQVADIIREALKHTPPER